MKARVKATGKTIDVKEFADGVYVSTYNDDVYLEENLDFWGLDDYWVRLEHTYAGMAMQGMLASREHYGLLTPNQIASDAYKYAHALVKKLKESK